MTTDITREPQEIMKTAVKEFLVGYFGEPAESLKLLLGIMDSIEYTPMHPHMVAFFHVLTPRETPTGVNVYVELPEDDDVPDCIQFRAMVEIKNTLGKGSRNDLRVITPNEAADLIDASLRGM